MFEGATQVKATYDEFVLISSLVKAVEAFVSYIVILLNVIRLYCLICYLERPGAWADFK